MASDNVATALKKARAKGLTQQVLGWIITIFCGLMASVGAGSSGFKETVDVVMVTMFALFTVLGVRLIIKGCKRKKLIKNYYDYSARLSADPDKSLDLLASSIGATVAAVTKDVSDMIALGFFPGAFLDTAHNRIVMKEDKPIVTQTNPVAASTTTTQAVKYITVQCRGCGATNKIIAGTVGECEFCGSQISDN
ncbi:MAG: hypothetical protein PHE47_01210 [Oscillospiraceae bacterium]|nr:hypothetical protein [Oscillospiraceae bacterium]